MRTRSRTHSATQPTVLVPHSHRYLFISLFVLYSMPVWLCSICSRLTINPVRHPVKPVAVYLLLGRRTGLQPLQSFLIKAIQLYEMIVVRHGLMLVGQSYGMKTSVYRTLAAALTGGHCEDVPLLQVAVMSVYCLLGRPVENMPPQHSTW